MKKILLHPITWTVSALLLLLAFISSEFAAEWAHRRLVSYIGEASGCRVEMERPRISWLSGSIDAAQLSFVSLTDKEGEPIFSADRLRVRVFPWIDIFTGKFGIWSAELERPSVRLKVEGGRIANLPKLLDGKKKSGGTLSFAVRSVAVKDGHLILSYPEKALDADLSHIEMTLSPDIAAGIYGVRIPDGSGTVRIGDKVQKVDSFGADFRVTRNDLTVIGGRLQTPEGLISLEGLFIDFASGRWEGKGAAAVTVSGLRELSVRWGKGDRLRDFFDRYEPEGDIRLVIGGHGDKKEFSAKGRASATRLGLKGGIIRKASVSFDIGGDPSSPERSSFKLDAGLGIPAGLFRRLSDRMPEAQGTVDAKVSVNSFVPSGGMERKTDVECGISSRHIKVEGVSIWDMKALLRYGDEILVLKDAEARVFGGGLSGRGEIDLKGEKVFSGSLNIKNVDLHEVEKSRIWKQDLDIFGSVSGQAGFEGKLAPSLHLTVTPEISAAGLRIKGRGIGAQGEIKGSGRISYADRRVTIPDLELNSGRSGIKLNGEIATGDMSIYVNLSSDSLSDVIGGLGGAGRVNGKVSGKPENPEIEGEMLLANLSWDRYRLDTVSGRLSYRDRVAGVRELKAVRGETVLSAAGEISAADGISIDLSFDMGNGRLEDLASFASLKTEMWGSMHASGSLTGKPGALNGRIEAGGRDILILSEDIDSIDLVCRLHDGDIFIDTGKLQKRNGNAKAEGMIGADGRLDIRTEGEISLEGLRSMRDKRWGQTGLFSFAGVAAGTIREPSLTARAALSGAGIKGLELGDGEMNISATRERVDIDGGLHGIKARGTASLTGTRPFHIEISADDLDVSPLMKMNQALKEMEGKLSAEISLDGDMVHPEDAVVRGKISKAMISREPFILKNDGDIEVEARRRKVLIKPFRLSGRGTELDAGGVYDSEGETSLHARGTLDLGFVDLFTPAINKGSGIADVSVSYKGKPPRLEGYLVIRDGVIGFKGFEPMFSGLSGRMGIKEGLIAIDSLSGVVGEGRFRGEGNVVMEGLQVARTDLSFDLTGVHLALPRWLPGEIDGNLRLSGEYPDLLLSGDLNVVHASFTERVDWKNMIPSFRKRLNEPMKLREGKGLMKIDINLRAEKNLIFENNLGKAELKGDLKLKGDTSRLGLVGFVEVISGTMKYKEHQFELTYGVLEFPDPARIETLLDFSAEGKIRDYDVRILVQGNIKDPKVTMTSTPPLSELDIASLIAIGLTSSEFQEKGGGEAPAYSAMSLLSREVEGGFKEYMGVDRFHIDPYYSRVTGTTEPKLSVGKELSEDIFVEYSSGLTGTGEQEVELEYKLLRNFSLMGGWSSFGKSNEGDIGVDMKFRFEFR